MWRRKGATRDQTAARIDAIWVQAEQRLTDLPTWAKSRAVILYAASPAERLMRAHEHLPAEARRPYSASWRPVLNHVWTYAAGDETVFEPISHALGQYLLSPQSHNLGQDGPDDADQDEVAATIFAAEAVMHGLVQFALLAASRATDAIDNRWYGVDDTRRATEIEAEVDRQRTDLQLIDRAAADRAAWSNGAPAELITRLRD